MFRCRYAQLIGDELSNIKGRKYKLEILLAQRAYSYFTSLYPEGGGATV